MIITPTVRTLQAARRTTRAWLLAGALTPAMLAAQGPTTAQSSAETEQRIDGPSYARVALLFTQIYDDNIFAVPQSQRPQSDLVSRFGPTFEVGRHSRRLEMSAKYGLAAERFFDRVDLNSDIAFQDGGFNIRYNSTPRTVLTFNGQYVDTQSPQDLNLTTGITTGRARAERLLGYAGITQDVSRIVKLNIDYQASNDTLAEINTNLSHNARFGLAWHATPRSIYRVDVRGRYVTFDFLRQSETGQQFRERGRQTSEALTGGWTYSLTPLTTFEIDAGPRLTAGEWRPEVSSTLRRRMQKGEISAGYLSTQDTSLGDIGFVDVHRATVGLSVTPVRPLTMSAVPAYARTTRLGQTTDVRELDVDIVVRVLRRLSFTASARVADQSGVFNGLDDPIESRRLWLSTTLTLP